MEPIELPPDMELVETRPGTKPVSDEATVEPKPRARRRTARPTESAPTPDALVQIETQGEPEADNADNA